MRLRVAAILAVAFIAGGAILAASIRYPVASEPRPGNGYMLALAVGVLEGRVNLDRTACMWLDAGGHRTALYWPFHYVAGGLPLGIFDASGKRLATVGDRVHVGGGSMKPEVKSIPGCAGFDGYWAAAPGALT